MSAINDGGQAFPIQAAVDGQGRVAEAMQPGMSLRDYFAAKAMAAQVSRDSDHIDGFDDDKTTAKLAYKYADAMIAARAR